LNRLINIGFGNVVNSNKIIGIISPEAAPIKRMVQNAKDAGTAIDATCGRKTKAVIVTESGHLVLSALLPETIANRVNVKEETDTAVYYSE
jgi:extracellular matrix regulatory protein A